MLSQGDVIYVDFNPTRGHEPQKRRPAVVVSTFEFNTRSSLTFVSPITSTSSSYPLHVPITGDDAGVEGSICLEATRSLDLTARPWQLVGSLCIDDLCEVLNRLAPIFGL